MSEKKIPPRERIASSFKKLATSSTELNAAADELSKSISTLEAALHKLNLGVPAWHTIAGDADEDGSYWSRDIGYTSLGKTWGIALRQVSGNDAMDYRKSEIWPFKDAPRWMCIESAGKIPELFDELIKRTEETTQKLKARTTETDELAKVVKEAGDELVAW